MIKSVFTNQLFTGRTVKKDVYLIFDGSTIQQVSAAKKGKLIGEYPVITPAFIDPHSHIGMHRSGEPSAEGETNDHIDSILALPDALDSVQMDDVAFQDAIEMGVLYSCIVPGSGNIERARCWHGGCGGIRQ